MTPQTLTTLTPSLSSDSPNTHHTDSIIEQWLPKHSPRWLHHWSVTPQTLTTLTPSLISDSPNTHHTDSIIDQWLPKHSPHWLHHWAVTPQTLTTLTPSLSSDSPNTHHADSVIEQWLPKHSPRWLHYWAVTPQTLTTLTPSLSSDSPNTHHADSIIEQWLPKHSPHWLHHCQSNSVELLIKLVLLLSLISDSPNTHHTDSIIEQWLPKHSPRWLHHWAVTPQTLTTLTPSLSSDSPNTHYTDSIIEQWLPKHSPRWLRHWAVTPQTGQYAVLRWRVSPQRRPGLPRDQQRTGGTRTLGNAAPSDGWEIGRSPRPNIPISTARWWWCCISFRRSRRAGSSQGCRRTFDRAWSTRSRGWLAEGGRGRRCRIGGRTHRCQQSRGWGPGGCRGWWGGSSQGRWTTTCGWGGNLHQTMASDCNKNSSSSFASHRQVAGNVPVHHKVYFVTHPPVIWKGKVCFRQAKITAVDG